MFAQTLASNPESLTFLAQRLDVVMGTYVRTFALLPALEAFIAQLEMLAHGRTTRSIPLALHANLALAIVLADRRATAQAAMLPSFLVAAQTRSVTVNASRRREVMLASVLPRPRWLAFLAPFEPSVGANLNDLVQRPVCGLARGTPCAGTWSVDLGPWSLDLSS